MMLEVAQTASRFWFAISRAGADVVVALHGELDQPSVEALRPVIRDLVDYQGNQSVAVDLRSVSYVDPSAEALFRDGVRWAQRHRASFRVRPAHAGARTPAPLLPNDGVS